MLGKIIGAFLGGKLAERTDAIGGPAGATLGVVAPAILRRMSWPALAAITVGGLIAKNLSKRDPRRKNVAD